MEWDDASQAVDSSVNPEPALRMLPPEFSGLDPLLRSHWKMYIADILGLPKIDVLPGVFEYKGRPVGRVEVQGVVVSVQIKNKFTVYAVDDATGVINCICWHPQDVAHTETMLSTLAGNLGGELRGKVQELQNLHESSQSPHDLGDLLRVRGRLRDFQGRREITCYYHAKQVDPNEEVRWMMVLPPLYSGYYNQALQLPRTVSQDVGFGGQGQCSKEAMHTLLDQCQVQTAVLSHLKSSGVSFTSVDQLAQVEAVKNAVHASYRQDFDRVHALVEKVVGQLLQIGHLFQSRSTNKDFMVTQNCPDLKEAVLQVLRTHSQNQQYADRGCHYMHIMDILKKTVQFAGLSKAALLHCLAGLEAGSHIISLTEKHFICLDV